MDYAAHARMAELALILTADGDTFDAGLAIELRNMLPKERDTLWWSTRTESGSSGKNNDALTNTGHRTPTDGNCTGHRSSAPKMAWAGEFAVRNDGSYLFIFDRFHETKVDPVNYIIRFNNEIPICMKKSVYICVSIRIPFTNTTYSLGFGTFRKIKNPI